jgi:hypothetical protein
MSIWNELSHFMFGLIPALTAATFLGLLFALIRLLRRISAKSIAAVCICLNALHLLCSLIFRHQFLPSTTSAFPFLVQVLFWLEFVLIGFVISPFVDRSLERAQSANVEDLSITSVKPRGPIDRQPISASDWRWMIAAVASYICLVITVFSLRPPKFVQ